jgi:hypothetical protein
MYAFVICSFFFKMVGNSCITCSKPVERLRHGSERCTHGILLTSSSTPMAETTWQEKVPIKPCGVARRWHHLRVNTADTV